MSKVKVLKRRVDAQTEDVGRIVEEMLRQQQKCEEGLHSKAAKLEEESTSFKREAKRHRRRVHVKRLGKKLVVVLAVVGAVVVTITMVVVLL